ncbi:hypothetical protein A3Q37_02774 [Streptomyces sp. PTY087I2]|nr:hypothetical protein A3Q37_02774 [Streptomyces sp. PTY087I2]
MVARPTRISGAVFSLMGCMVRCTVWEMFD